MAKCDPSNPCTCGSPATVAEGGNDSGGGGGQTAALPHPMSSEEMTLRQGPAVPEPCLMPKIRPDGQSAAASMVPCRRLMGKQHRWTMPSGKSTGLWDSRGSLLSPAPAVSHLVPHSVQRCHCFNALSSHLWSWCGVHMQVQVGVGYCGGQLPFPPPPHTHKNVHGPQSLPICL